MLWQMALSHSLSGCEAVLCSLLARAAANMAMLCRGSSGKFYSLQDFSFSRNDGIWATCTATALLALGFVEWMS